MNPELSNHHWKILTDLRDGFLTQKRHYWTSEEQLSLYDRFFAQRIGWKWQAVVQESKQLKVSETLLDWGCGTGIASRVFLEHYPAKTVHLVDQSPLAVSFAEKAILNSFPNVRVERGIPTGGFTLLLSHVLNELREDKELDSLFNRAASIFWVEPGTKEVASRLVEWREKLKDRFFPVAPCPHTAPCGLLGHPKHWCHHFAPSPSTIFQSSEWKAFSKNVGVDLRSLPLSYLVLQSTPPEPAAEHYREIGEARFYKGYLKTLLCHAKGVNSARFLKKSDPTLFKAWKKFEFSRKVPESNRALQFEER